MRRYDSRRINKQRLDQSKKHSLPGLMPDGKIGQALYHGYTHYRGRFSGIFFLTEPCRNPSEHTSFRVSSEFKRTRRNDSEILMENCFPERYIYSRVEFWMNF